MPNTTSTGSRSPTTRSRRGDPYFPAPGAGPEPRIPDRREVRYLKYQRWLSSTSGQAAVPYLEARYKDELLRGKLIRGVIGDVYVSDAALWERYRDEKEQVKVASLKIDPSVAITDQAVSVTPQEIEDYYRAHKDEFKRSRAAYLSFVSVPRLPDASDTAAALERARSLREEILKGAPFAEVAKRESADTVSGKLGGELGVMNKAQVDPAFAAAVATLRAQGDFGTGEELVRLSHHPGRQPDRRHLQVPPHPRSPLGHVVLAHGHEEDADSGAAVRGLVRRELRSIPASHLQPITEVAKPVSLSAAARTQRRLRPVMTIRATRMVNASAKVSSMKTPRIFMSLDLTTTVAEDHLEFLAPGSSRTTPSSRHRNAAADPPAPRRHTPGARGAGGPLEPAGAGPPRPSAIRLLIT